MTIFLLSTNRLVVFLLAMAIILAVRAMFSATTPTSSSPAAATTRTTPTNFVLPLDFIAASASSWKSKYHQKQQNNSSVAATTTNVKQASSAKTTTKEAYATGARVKELQHEQSGSLLFRNNINPPFYDYAATSSSSPSLVIFYNIFIPPETDADADDVVQTGGSGSGGAAMAIQNALRIVTAQTQQIRQSHAASSSSSSSSNNNNKTALTVFYNTMGNPTALNHSFMQNLCAGPLLQSSSSNNNIGSSSSSSSGGGGDRQLLLPIIHCRHLQHFMTGHEEETLNHLHSFCLQHSNHSVVYLHSKGSFHDRPYNEAWRPHLTAAATSRMCIDAVVGWNSNSRSSNSTSACNLCSLQFYPIWSMFVPGNMWIASCQYVQHLLPLPLFQARMKQVEHDVQQDLRHTAGSGDSVIWKATLYPWSPMTVGTRRWSNEHWIASHPHVVPCDLSQTARLQTWQKQQRQQQSQGEQQSIRSRQMTTTTTRGNDNGTMKNVKREYVWAMAPRHPIISMRYQLNLKRLGNLLQLNNIIAENVADINDRIPANDRFREWFLLPGFLMKWNVLYQDQSSSSSSSSWAPFPPSSSWIWKWFPDGDYWKASVQKWGLNQTVARILRRHV